MLHNNLSIQSYRLESHHIGQNHQGVQDELVQVYTDYVLLYCGLMQ